MLKIILVLISAFFVQTKLYASEDCLPVTRKPDTFTQGYRLGYASTLVRSNNAYANRYAEFSGTNGYNLTRAGGPYIAYRFQKQFEDRAQRYEADFGNIGYRQVFCLGPQSSLSTLGFYGLPVNRDDRHYDHSRGQLTNQTSLVWKNEALGLTAGVRGTIRRHFYEYTDDNGGRFLKRWSFEPAVAVAFVRHNWSLSVEFIDLMGWDFRGEQQRSHYYHTEGLSYAFDDSWKLTLSHRSDGTLANATGTGADVSLHDEDRSELALTISFED